MTGVERLGLVFIPLGAILLLIAKVLRTVQDEPGTESRHGGGLLLLLGVVLVVVGICLELIARGRQG